MVWTILGRLLLALFISAISRGVLLFLHDKGIQPEVWVAAILGIAETSVRAHMSAYAWILSGAIGLLCMGGFYMAKKWGFPYIITKRKTRSYEPSQQPSSPVNDTIGIQFDGPVEDSQFKDLHFHGLGTAIKAKGPVKKTLFEGIRIRRGKKKKI